MTDDSFKDARHEDNIRTVANAVVFALEYGNGQLAQRAALSMNCTPAAPFPSPH
jgi:hypothetical protein